MDYKYYICCNECAVELMDENSSIYLAWLGPQGKDDDEPAVLVCCDWENRLLLSAQKFFCDWNECGREVAVAPSSGWFVERHKKERSA